MVAFGVTVIELATAPVLHVIVPPTQPDAVKVTCVPAHMVEAGLTEIVGGVVLLPTLTVTLPAGLSHLPVVALQDAV